MRVLLVSHRFPPDELGGVEHYTHRLAVELVKAGDPVSVVTRKWAASGPEIRTRRERSPDGFTVHRFAGRKVHHELFLADSPRLEELFKAALLEANPEVVHFNHLLGLSPSFVEIAHRLRVAVVISLHDFYF